MDRPLFGVRSLHMEQVMFFVVGGLDTVVVIALFTAAVVAYTHYLL